MQTEQAKKLKTVYAGYIVIKLIYEHDENIYVNM